MPLPVNRALPSMIESAKAALPAAAPASLLHVSSREVPPGGFTYKITALAERAPQAAWVGPFNDTETLTKEVNRRELANQLPPSSLMEVENQLCQRLPPGYCRDASNRSTTRPGSLALHLADVIIGTKTLAGWFRHGSVPNEEIIRRTRICNECPENLPIVGCQGCAGAPLRALVDAIVVKPLPSDAVLGACGICKCGLKAKTRMKLEDILPHMPADQKARLPDKCWIIAEATPRDSDPRT